MHPCAPAPVAPAKPGHALRGLACLLLLGWAARPTLARAAVPRTDPAQSSSPYLRASGPLSLRFEPAPVPKELTARPAASGPPFPLPESAPTAEHPPVASEPEAKPALPDVILPATPSAAPVTPPPIIPDDTRPRVQAEDFLPYFRFPSPPEAALVLPPNPPHHATPSTATYRQQ